MVALLRDERYDVLPIDQVIHGECLSIMRAWPDNCIDSAVLDPPAGIFFMSKKFDHDRGGRDKWIAWLAEIMREVLRVLRPGASCLVWSLPRTSHWTGLALEQAGFEMRDCLYHLHSPDSALATFQASLTETQKDALERLLDSQEVSSSILHLFGSGFPKSLDVGKAIHRHLDVEREVIGRQVLTGNAAYEIGKTHSLYHSSEHMGDATPTTGEKSIPLTASSPGLQQYEGIGSALKPSAENWWLCRKPLSEKTIAENVLKWNCGGLNIDKSRVGTTDTLTGSGSALLQFSGQNTRPYQKDFIPGGVHQHSNGRFPSHVTFSHSLFCTEDACAEGCPVLALEQQSGVSKSVRSKRVSIGSIVGNSNTHGHMVSAYDNTGGYNDTGTASRFYHTFTPDPFLYAAKASRAERSKGCEELPTRLKDSTYGDGLNSATKVRTEEQASIGVDRGFTTNTHPTVKNQQLMRYLVSLITPPNGIVLDCFAGSGSTLVAAITEGYHFIGIEMNNTPDEPYVDIARARVSHALTSTPLNTREVHA